MASHPDDGAHTPTLIQWRRVPRVSASVWSIVAHLLAAALVVVFINFPRPHVVRRQYIARVVSGATRLVLNARPPGAPPVPARVRRTRRPAPIPPPGSATEGPPATEVLRAQAKQATAAIIHSIKFHQIYGFSPGPEYHLPLQTAGELPNITPEQLPPRYQQYVIVEITIDTDGRVADARIIAGLVEPAIQQTLLSAVRQFKYNPATWDGAAIPFQQDIVIHVPS